MTGFLSGGNKTKTPVKGFLPMSAGNGLPGVGRMRAAPVWEVEPTPRVERFHLLAKAERHALQRFAAQLPRISYAV